MGQDKALLPHKGTTLLDFVARTVCDAVGSAAIIGDPDRYGSFGYPVYPDKVNGYGPLGGIWTALGISKTEWNLIVACDMPGLSVQMLSTLMARIDETGRDCVAAVGPSGDLEPLCAVYHRRCLPFLELAIGEKRLKMKDIVTELQVERVYVDGLAIANINTPSDWASENL